MSLTVYETIVEALLLVLPSGQKCSFKGKGDSGTAQLRKFEDDSALPYTDPCNTKLVLAEVDDVTDDCRHRFTAKLTDSCGLAAMYFEFGKEAGGADDEYPHKIEIKESQSETDDDKYILKIDENVSSMWKRGKGLFEDSVKYTIAYNCLTFSRESVLSGMCFCCKF